MEPEQTPQQVQQPPAGNTSEKKSIALPLFLILWPVGFFLAALVGYVLVNLFLPDQAANGELFAQPHPAKAAINVVLFLAGATAAVFGPITFIIGLVLLIQRKSKTIHAQN